MPDKSTSTPTVLYWCVRNPENADVLFFISYAPDPNKREPGAVIIERPRPHSKNRLQHANVRSLSQLENVGQFLVSRTETLAHAIREESEAVTLQALYRLIVAGLSVASDSSLQTAEESLGGRKQLQALFEAILKSPDAIEVLHSTHGLRHRGIPPMRWSTFQNLLIPQPEQALDKSPTAATLPDTSQKTDPLIQPPGPNAAQWTVYNKDQPKIIFHLSFQSDPTLASSAVLSIQSRIRYQRPGSKEQLLLESSEMLDLTDFLVSRMLKLEDSFLKNDLAGLQFNYQLLVAGTSCASRSTFKKALQILGDPKEVGGSKKEGRTLRALLRNIGKSPESCEALNYITHRPRCDIPSIRHATIEALIENPQLQALKITQKPKSLAK